MPPLFRKLALAEELYIPDQSWCYFTQWSPKPFQEIRPPRLWMEELYDWGAKQSNQSRSIQLYAWYFKTSEQTQGVWLYYSRNPWRVWTVFHSYGAGQGYLRRILRTILVDFLLVLVPVFLSVGLLGTPYSEWTLPGKWLLLRLTTTKDDHMIVYICTYGFQLYLGYNYVIKNLYVRKRVV